MQEQLLEQMKAELQQRKKQNEQHNQKIIAIRNLEKQKSIKKYLELTELDKYSGKPINISDEKLIKLFYRGYLHQVKETNGIYVYLGTFQNSSIIDIEHGANDIRVNYNSTLADYRNYKNLESSYAINIPIAHCKEFESENIVINPDTFNKNEAYYKIQDEFFVSAIKYNQETAKKRILRNYRQLNKKS